jgi:hypothetical protein
MLLIVVFTNKAIPVQTEGGGGEMQRVPGFKTSNLRDNLQSGITTMMTAI